MKFRQVINSVLSVGRPQRKLAALLPELRELRNSVGPLMANPDRLTALISLLDILSRWADRGAIAEVIAMFDEVNYGQYDELRGRLGEIQSCLTGIRDRYGWNRTQAGETVTDDKVYLGNCFGIWTFTVAHFKSKRNDPRTIEGKRGMINAYDIVSEYQGYGYVKTVGTTIVTGIDAIERMHQSDRLAA